MLPCDMDIRVLVKKFGSPHTTGTTPDMSEETPDESLVLSERD